ncbi:MAG: NUDIX domain-containing protein [Paludibacteraceae bacterium]|nr:NUDIX domain-containing protein [Paludibacteraceae bacterium]
MKKENVLCVPVNSLTDTFDINTGYWPTNKDSINKLPFIFKARELAESDFSHKQLIAYALVFNEIGELLHYQRCGSEKRLKGIWSAGIGGHTNDNDKGDSLYDTLTNGLIREFEEETGLKIKLEDIELLGMINEEQTEVGHCHTGVVFKITINPEKLVLDTEIGNPHWETPELLDLTKFELWSGLAIKLTSHK